MGSEEEVPPLGCVPTIDGGRLANQLCPLPVSHRMGEGGGPIGSGCSWSGCTLKPDPGVVDKTDGVILYIVPGG